MYWYTFQCVQCITDINGECERLYISMSVFSKFNNQNFLSNVYVVPFGNPCCDKVQVITSHGLLGFTIL